MRRSQALRHNATLELAKNVVRLQFSDAGHCGEAKCERCAWIRRRRARALRALEALKVRWVR